MAKVKKVKGKFRNENAPDYNMHKLIRIQSQWPMRVEDIRKYLSFIPFNLRQSKVHPISSPNRQK